MSYLSPPPHGILVPVFITRAALGVLMAPRSEVLLRQKLKTNLSRTQSSKIFPLRLAIGQNIATHASLTAKDFSFELISSFPVHSPPFFSKPLPSFFFFFSSSFFFSPLLAVDVADVSQQNEIGHLACCHRQLMRVPVLSAPGIRIGLKARVNMLRCVVMVSAWNVLTESCCRKQVLWFYDL